MPFLSWSHASLANGLDEITMHTQVEGELPSLGCAASSAIHAHGGGKRPRGSLIRRCRLCRQMLPRMLAAPTQFEGLLNPVRGWQRARGLSAQPLRFGQDNRRHDVAAMSLVGTTRHASSNAAFPQIAPEQISQKCAGKDDRHQSQHDTRR